MFTLRPFGLIGKFWQDKTLSLIFRWTFVAILVQVALIAFSYQKLPQLIPFYFSLPWGESWLAPVDYIFLLPSISFLILLVNNFISSLFIVSVRLFSILLSVTSLVCSVFLCYSIFQILRLVL